MASREIIVTREDFNRLVEILKDKLLGAIAAPQAFRELAYELQHATIVDADSVPGDVVTMNSTVKLANCESKETETYTLVYPEDANIAEGSLSILAPIGIAILGYRVGDRVPLTLAIGKSDVRIEELIYQPERDSAVA